MLVGRLKGDRSVFTFGTSTSVPKNPRPETQLLVQAMRSTGGAGDALQGRQRNSFCCGKRKEVFAKLVYTL